MTKLLVNGEEQDVDLQLDKLFVKINGEYYVKTINIEKQILTELEEWLKLVMGNASLKWGESCAREFDLGCLDIEMTMKNYGEVLNKIQELKEKYK